MIFENKIEVNSLIRLVPTITVNEEVQHLFSVCSIEINIVRRMSKDPFLKVKANKKNSLCRGAIFLV